MPRSPKPSSRAIGRAAVLATLRERHGLDPETAEALAARMAPRTLRSGSVLLRIGERDGTLYLTERGLLRVAFAATDGAERTKAFVSEGMFFVGLTAYVTDQPSALEVSALEDTRLWTLPYAVFQAEVERSLALSALWRRTMQAHFIRHEAREQALQLRDARDRYQWFRDTHPHLSDRVPLRHVASYLGITDVTLSRARRSLGLIER